MRGGWQQPLPDMAAPPPARAWRRMDAPPGYEAQWRRLAEAALELGLGPEQLAETGLDPVAAARGWKPATVALYSKVARYGGVALPRVAWPAPVAAFRSLRREQVHATARRLLIATDDGEWSVPGALIAWHAWESVR